jgi:hypothetical protein
MIFPRVTATSKSRFHDIRDVATCHQPDIAVVIAGGSGSQTLHQEYVDLVTQKRAAQTQRKPKK